MPNSASSYAHLTQICRSYGATLVAVSKTRPLDQMMALYAQGQRLFAENRAQEIAAKAPLMPPDVTWHLIGHLQTNKIRMSLPYLSCIQSLDSARLWSKIHDEAVRLDRTIDCLLEIKIAREDTKYGWDREELIQLLTSNAHAHWTRVHIRGVMGIASLTEDMDQVRMEMRQLKQTFDLLKTSFFRSDGRFNILSMGMSGDYTIALEEGSNMIRIGTMLFANSSSL